jgi:hypothetical protein
MRACRAGCSLRDRPVSVLLGPRQSIFPGKVAKIRSLPDCPAWDMGIYYAMTIGGAGGFGESQRELAFINPSIQSARVAPGDPSATSGARDDKGDF